MTKRKTELLDHNTLRAEVARYKAAGMTGSWNDGGGLTLRLTPAGKARFVHRYTFRGRTPEHWLPGEYPTEITLTEARHMRDTDRALVAADKDPLAATAEDLEVPTLEAFCRKYFRKLAPKCERDDPVNSCWMRDMTHRIGHLGKVPISDVRLTDVEAALRHYWDGDRATPTAERLVGRIRRAVDLWHALERPNDDTWRNPITMPRLKARLGDEPHVVKNQTSLPFMELPAVMAALREVDSMPARLAEFTILTGVRTVEAREARWQEIDWRARTWTIPATRMKGRKEHVVPLSLGMVRCLRRAAKNLPCRPTDLMFPSFAWVGIKPVEPQPFNPHPARYALRDAAPGSAATLHGMRAALTAWGVAVRHRRQPPFELQLMDKCLAHIKVKDHDPVSAAIRHYAHNAGVDPFLDRRRVVMREWSVFLDGRAGPAAAATAPAQEAAARPQLRLAA